MRKGLLKMSMNEQGNQNDDGGILGFTYKRNKPKPRK